MWDLGDLRWGEWGISRMLLTDKESLLVRSLCPQLALPQSIAPTGTDWSEHWVQALLAQLQGLLSPDLLAQAEELRTQLRLLEDARDGLRRELLEAQRKVRESQEAREAQRQEVGELRRSLSEGAKEREALRRSNEELRAAVRKAEGERIR